MSEWSVQWFGTDWGAPVCREAQRVDVPVGRRCLGCSAEIAPDDDGLMVPLLAEQATMEPWHLDCFARNLGISSDAPDGD